MRFMNEIVFFLDIYDFNIKREHASKTQTEISLCRQLNNEIVKKLYLLRVKHRLVEIDVDARVVLDMIVRIILEHVVSRKLLYVIHYAL